MSRKATSIKRHSRRPRALSEADILAAAEADPEAQPLTGKQLRAMKRVALAKQIRWKLGLSQEEFAARFQIPLGTLRDWEQHRTEPDQAAQAYLKVIAADAKFVARAVGAEP
jgi:putative transcriptional regulator